MLAFLILQTKKEKEEKNIFRTFSVVFFAAYNLEDEGSMACHTAR